MSVFQLTFTEHHGVCALGGELASTGRPSLQGAPGKPSSLRFWPKNEVQYPRRGFLALHGSSHGSVQSSWSLVLPVTLNISFFCGLLPPADVVFFVAFCLFHFVLFGLYSPKCFSACCFWPAASDLWVRPLKHSHDVIMGKDGLGHLVGHWGLHQDFRVCLGSGGRRSQSPPDSIPC